MKTFNDTDLREALRRKYADVPQMPLNLGERIMKEAPLYSPNEKETPSRFSSSSRNWVMGGLLAAASIALLLVLHFGNNPSEEQPMVVQKTNLGMKDEGIGMKDAGIEMKEASSNVPLLGGSRGAPLTTSNKVKKVKRKAVRKSNFAMPAPTDADQMLAETEAAPAEERPARAHLSPEQEVLLAMEAREQDFRSRGKRLQREIEEMMRN